VQSTITLPTVNGSGSIRVTPSTPQLEALEGREEQFQVLIFNAAHYVMKLRFGHIESEPK